MFIGLIAILILLKSKRLPNEVEASDLPLCTPLMNQHALFIASSITDTNVILFQIFTHYFKFIIFTTTKVIN